MFFFGFFLRFPDKRFLAFYHHKFSNERAYLITETKFFYYATDTGRTWYEQGAPTPPNTFGVEVLRFHSNTDTLIWTEASYTRDNGRKWYFVEKYVRNCVFTKDKDLYADPTEIVCDRATSLVSSTKPSTKLSKPIPTPISTPAPAPPKASKPLQPPPPSSAPLATLTRAVRPTLVPPPSSAPAVPASKPQPNPVPLLRKKHKRERDPAPPASGSTSASHHFFDTEEEDLQFENPTKRARSSQGPGLALPGASAATFPVSATVLSVAAAETMEVGSESDDDVWDEVAVVGKTVETEDKFDISGGAARTTDDAEDINMDKLEREINMHMDEAGDDDDEDDDFLAAVVNVTVADIASSRTS
ncbi:hypothetical protein E4T56_gene4344 [Termitomyces sp. T112]|nr:hypothetical protein E4T56_gene4344 [Termitomyces sp. T112]